MRGPDVLLQTRVAIGAPATPTPPGRYSVTDTLPASIGHAASFGCVRLPNALIVQLAEVPLGTPVFVS